MAIRFGSFPGQAGSSADGTKTEADSKLNQLIDVIQEDISGSVTRKKYQVFVTGGIGPGVTSSLFQTVFDQDFSLQTANPIMDLTVGLFFDQTAQTTDVHGFTSGGGVSTNTPAMDICTAVNSNTRPLFPSSSLMMREKIDIYRQHAKALLGDANAGFYLGTNFPANNLDTN